MVSPVEQHVTELDRALATLSAEVAAFVRETRADSARLKNELSALSRAAEERDRAAEERDRAAEERTTRFELGMAEFNQESRRERRNFNRELGAIAAAQGKLVEDIAAPSVPRVLCTLLGLPEDEDLDLFAIRLKLKHPVRRGENAEIDVIAAHGQTALIVEVKQTLTPERLVKHAESLPRVCEFLPQLSGHKLLGAVASVYVDPSLVAHAERLGLYVLAAGDDLLSIQNGPEFSPRVF